MTPFSHRRDQAVAAAWSGTGGGLRLQPGLLLAEPESLLTAAGRPYGVFTPFWRALQAAAAGHCCRPPERIARRRTLLASGRTQPCSTCLAARRRRIPACRSPGSRPRRSACEPGSQGGLAGYGERRNELDGEATSHLGADLHLGTLSPLQVECAALELGRRGAALRAAARLARVLPPPALPSARRPHHGRRQSRSWPPSESEADDPEAVAAWREGRTGVPVVDAGMRQLAATSWLSNRARLVVASFLTRHLLMDYRIGERHFLRHLVDGDVANNLGGWQWTAGVGADPQPWFRIFNPVLQGRRFDPEGDWVRRWVPELAQVPEHAHPCALGDAGRRRAPRPACASARPTRGPSSTCAEARERALAAFRSIVGRETPAADAPGDA